MTKRTLPRDWCDEARRVLKVEMARKDVSYKQLARVLDGVGVKCDDKMLSTKINRGTFSFVFFLQCMHALNVSVIRLSEPLLVDLPLRTDGKS